ncbi:hypothetical protein IWZ01DRAFT_559144 [Phyllosticta capitalensis]
MLAGMKHPLKILLGVFLLAALPISSALHEDLQQTPSHPKPTGNPNATPNDVCTADQAARWKLKLAYSKSVDEKTCKDAPHRDACDQCVIGYAAAMTGCIVACCVNIETGPLIAVCITGCIGAYEGAVGACFDR